MSKSEEYLVKNFPSLILHVLSRLVTNHNCGVYIFLLKRKQDQTRQPILEMMSNLSIEYIYIRFQYLFLSALASYRTIIIDCI